MNKYILLILSIFITNELRAETYSGIYSNCFFKKITNPEYKDFERNSFSEMNNFRNIYKSLPDKHFINNGFIFPKSEINSFQAVEILVNAGSRPGPLTIKVFAELKSGETYARDGSFEPDVISDKIIGYKPDYKRYGSVEVVLFIEKKEIEIKHNIFLYNNNKSQDVKNSSFSTFLKCEKHVPFKWKSKKIEEKNNNFIYLIFIAIFLSIVFFVYRHTIKK